MMGTVIAVAVFLCLRGGRELTEQERQAVDKAYDACAHKVDEAVNELEKWYMRNSDGSTAAAAGELIGEEAKRTMNASEEKCEEYTRAVVLKHLSTENEVTEMVLWELPVRNAWGKEEKRLARATNCPDLCGKVKIRNAKGKRVIKVFDDKILYENLRKEMFKAVQHMKDIESYRGALSGIANGVASIAVSASGAPKAAPIVGSLAGLAASKGLDWIANPAGDIQKILDDRVRKMAQERKKQFRDMMMKELDACRKEWERLISRAGGEKEETVE